MKKISLLLSLFLFTGIFMVSCDDKNKDDNGGWTPKSTDQIKEDLENTGMDMLTQMEAFYDEEIFDVLQDLSTQINSSPSVVPQEVFTALLSIRAENTKQLAANLKSLQEEISFQQIWNDSLTGTWTYSETIDDFIRTESPQDAVIIIIPATPSTLDKEVNVTINNVTFSPITEPYWENIDDFDEELDNYPTDIPSSANIAVTYGGTQLLGFTFAGAFLANGMPTSVSLELAVGNFVFYETLTHTPHTEASETFGFKNGSTILWEIYGKVDGDWSEENVNENTYTEYDQYDEWVNVNIDQIIKNANAHFRLMDIKAVGEVDFKSLAGELMAWEEANPSPDYDDYSNWDDYEAAKDEWEEANIKKITALLNTYGNFYMAYADGTTIAKIEFFAKESEEECDYEYQYNENTYQYDEVYVCETYWYSDAYLIFADDSKVDAELYFNENFKDVVTAYMDFITQLQNDFDFDFEDYYYY